jgi:hypothetical protein
VKTVFIQRLTRIAYRIKNDARAYGFAAREKRKGAESVVVANRQRTLYEEARLDGASQEIVFRKVHPPGGL